MKFPYELYQLVFLGKSVFETMKKRSGDKRKREKRGDPGDIDGYLGKTEFSSVEGQCQFSVSCGSCI